MSENPDCSLAEGFRLREKIYAQSSFFSMTILGTVGIVLADWPWVLPYVLINWYAVPGVVMRHLTCPRCPHLYEHGDCLQFPPKWTMRLIKRRKRGPFSRLEKYTFLLIFFLIPVYPLYWLRPNTILLAAFVLTAGMWYGGQFLYFCKRCRVQECPFNRVPSPAGGMTDRLS